jgi:hypothetical protein
MVAFDEGATVRMLAASCNDLFYLRRNRTEERK